MITARKSPWSCTTLPPRRRSPHDRALEKMEKLELSTIKSARRPLGPSANQFSEGGQHLPFGRSRCAAASARGGVEVGQTVNYRRPAPPLPQHRRSLPDGKPGPQAGA
jgi:hypothetical protein